MKHDAPLVFVEQHAHGLAGRLGFAAAPGTWAGADAVEPGRGLDADLAALRASGASVLVSLLEDAELERLGITRLVERARDAGLETRRFPVPDHSAPGDLQATAAVVRTIVRDLARGRTVVVHCRAGVGRSGIVVACCLVAAGSEPRRALASVRRAREGAAPGLDGFVHAFARTWARLASGEA